MCHTFLEAMGNRATKNVKSVWLDRYPNEILYLIFDYLSNNDILYAFFFFNQYFQNILLGNRRYIEYLELPDTNCKEWERILSRIGPQVECLSLNAIDLSFPSEYFPNLKSLIVRSPYAINDDELNLIFQSKQFSKLCSFKIQEPKSTSENLVYPRLFHQRTLLENVCVNYSLEIFEYSLINSPLELSKGNFLHGDLKLSSLTLNLKNFKEIALILRYTPNLTYLNIRAKVTKEPFVYVNSRSIQLKQIYLTLSTYKYTGECFPSIVYFLKGFSSSVNVLSLNFSCLNILNRDDLVLNSEKFKEFLESMNELQQFSYYGQIYRASYEKSEDNETILSKFQSSYWLNHCRWNSFGMHGNYFYTLPFQFDHLYKLNTHFNDIKSNNPQILIDNHRLWYKVKSIQLCSETFYDQTFLQQLKIKMPNLSSIECYTNIDHIQEKKQIIDLSQFNSVTTVQVKTLPRKYFEQQYFLRLSPNVKHLSLSLVQLDAIQNQRSQISHRNIQHLDIDVTIVLSRFSRNYLFLTNIRFINLCLDSCGTDAAFSAELILSILKDFRKLEILFIYTQVVLYNSIRFARMDLNKIFQYLNPTEIIQNFRIKRFFSSCLFLKKE